MQGEKHEYLNRSQDIRVGSQLKNPNFIRPVLKNLKTNICQKKFKKTTKYNMYKNLGISNATKNLTYAINIQCSLLLLYKIEIPIFKNIELSSKKGCKYRVVVMCAD